VHEKARAETLVADARKAVEEQAGVDRVRPLVAELQQSYHSLAAAGAGGGGDEQDDVVDVSDSDDDVIDADFTVG
jgi:molecular chaperone DnaK